LMALHLRSQNHELPRELVESLLPGMDHPNPHIRFLVSEVLACGPVELSLVCLISHLDDSDEAVAQSILATIRTWLPWTIGQPWEDVINPQRILDDAIRASLTRPSDDGGIADTPFLSRLATLHGAQAEILRGLASVDMTLAEEFQSLLRQQANLNHPPQITIVTTYRCNADCSYCYANTHRTSSSALVPLETFRAYLKHAVHLGYRRVGFTGGEPTLHPQFEEFVKAVREHDLTMFLATNGTFHTALVDHLDLSFVGAITAHLWFRPLSEHPARQLFVENIRQLRQRNLHVALRYTVCEGCDIAVDEIISIAQATGVQQITLALSIPDFSRGAVVLSRDAFRLEAQRLLDAARQFMKQGFRVALAKPLPTCVVAPEDLWWLAQTPYNVGTCPIWCVGGTHNLLLNDDGELWPCIALPGSLGKFLDCHGQEEISARCRPVIAELARRPLFDSCNSCDLWQLKRCQGACLAYKREPVLRMGDEGVVPAGSPVA